MSEAEEDPFMLMGPKELQVYIDQLKKESAIERIKTSEGSKIVMEFCKSMMDSDPLIRGIDNKHNPFVEKKDCSIV